MYTIVFLALFLGQAMFAQSVEGIVQGYLDGAAAKSEFNSKDFSEWKIKDIVPSLNPDIQHVYVNQYYQGIEVQDAVYKLTVKNAEVTWEINHFVKGIQDKVEMSKAALTPEAAILKVVAEHRLSTPKSLATSQAKTNGKYIYKDSGISLEPIEVKQVYQLIGDKLKLAWNVSLYQKNGEHWWNVNIDANTGKILETEDWVLHCNFGTPNHAAHNHATNETIDLFTTPPVKVAEIPTATLAGEKYNVYPIPVESPNHGSRSIVTDPANTVASPYGWHDTNGAAGAEYTITRGNNVWAQDDANGNNGTGASPNGGAALEFDFSLNLNQAPSTYLDAATTNLFYWNNIMHDVWYQYGFNEASGNFQENNYGNGGVGSDSVNADAQDGSGSNNANFSTPPDGGNPRMQMFLWNGNPQIDGDFDNVVIAHEYGHGISIRLVGGPSTNGLGGSEQMGEGWSDWFGLMLTMKAGDAGTDSRGVGSYVIGQGPNGGGIRPTPYSTDTSVNGTDYSDVNTLAAPHGVGYGFATILWDLTWALVDQEGFDADLYNGTGGNNIAMALVIEGLKNTANNPGYVSGRDGILQADQDLYGGQYNCLIWTVFSARGVGLGANENNNGGSNGKTDQTVSFVNGCDGGNQGCSGDVSSFPYNEGFEGSTGAWTQDVGDDLDWTVNTAGTPSNGTGPSGAVEGNSYIYVEASGNGTGYPNKRAILNSPCLDLSGVASANLNFQYHMTGDAIGTFVVEARTNNDGAWATIFTRTGAQGSDWTAATVDLASYVGNASVQLRLNTVTGSSWQGDVAIDGLSIEEGATTPTGCTGGIASFPYAEGFEGSTGAWSQGTGDDLNWTVDANGTPSNGTGPSGAVEGSSYIYVEASGNGTGYPNKRAILNSPCFDLSNLSAANFSFQYHMLGNAVGTLDVEASTNNGGSWTSVFNISGSQGSNWNTATIDLASYIGAGVQLRFNVVTGTSWQGDIVIDDVKLTETGSSADICDGIAEYSTSATYQVGTRVTYQGTLYERTSTGWTNLGQCGTALSSFGGEEVATLGENNFEVAIYPNPLKRGEVLNISINNVGPTKATYQVLNIVGQIVQAGDVTNKAIQMNSLETGMYILKVQGENQSIIKRFIIE